MAAGRQPFFAFVFSVFFPYKFFCDFFAFVYNSSFYAIFVFQFADIFIMIKSKVFRVLFFFFLVAGVPLITLGNTVTKEECKELLKSARKEYSQKNFSKSIEMYLKIKSLSETNGWIDIEINALNGLGVLYHHISDYKKAMDCYLEAYSLVLTEPNMKIDESKILNNIAGLYVIDNEYDKATDYYQKALLISRQIKDTVGMMYAFNNLGAIANQNKNMDLAIQYANSSLKLSQDVPTDRMINAQAIKAQALHLKKEYNAAEKLALKTFQQAQDYETDYRDIVPLILLIAEIYQAQGKGQQALSTAQKALDYSSGLQDIIYVYEQIATLYQKNQLSDLALTYKDSVMTLKDSLHKINAFNDIENTCIRFELLNSERELSENRDKQKAERTLFMVVAISIVILVCISFWLFRLRTIKNKQQKAFELEQKLKERETLALLEQERLKNEIENKNKQLIAKSLFQSNRNKLITELITAFSEAPSQNESLMVEKIIQQLKMQLKDLGDVNNFLEQYEQINPSLLLLLKEKHPTLSPDDIHLLSYIYLNMDIKRIAHLLNISVDACQKRKERLAVKLGIKTIDLHPYLFNIMRASISQDLS